jgi:hypothetical protein
VLAVALAGVAYLAWRWFQGRMPAAKVAFALFLLLFVVVLLRPSMWRPPIVMAPDRQGLIFVGSPEGVRVPWSETGPITIERARVMEGVSRTVIVAVSTQSAFWDRARQSPLRGLLLGDEKPPGFLRFPLGTQGIDRSSRRQAGRRCATCPAIAIRFLQSTAERVEPVHLQRVADVQSRRTQATKMPWTVQAGMIRTRRRPPCRARRSRRLLQ